MTDLTAGPDTHLKQQIETTIGRVLCAFQVKHSFAETQERDWENTFPVSLYGATDTSREGRTAIGNRCASFSAGSACEKNVPACFSFRLVVRIAHRKAIPRRHCFSYHDSLHRLKERRQSFFCQNARNSQPETLESYPVLHVYKRLVPTS